MFFKNKTLKCFIFKKKEHPINLKREELTVGA